MEASSTRGKKCKTSANGLKWALIAAMAWHNASGPQSACLRQSNLQDKDKKQRIWSDSYTYLQLQFLFIWTPLIYKPRKNQVPILYWKYLHFKVGGRSENWWNQQEIGTVTFPHTFSQCDVDSDSSALSSSAWRRRWPVPSLGSTGQDSDAPSLESQIVGV